MIRSKKLMFSVVGFCFVFAGCSNITPRFVAYQSLLESTDSVSVGLVSAQLKLLASSEVVGTLVVDKVDEDTASESITLSADQVSGEFVSGTISLGYGRTYIFTPRLLDEAGIEIALGDAVTYTCLSTDNQIIDLGTIIVSGADDSDEQTLIHVVEVDETVMDDAEGSIEITIESDPNIVIDETNIVYSLENMGINSGALTITDSITGNDLCVLQESISFSGECDAAAWPNFETSITQDTVNFCIADIVMPADFASCTVTVTAITEDENTRTGTFTINKEINYMPVAAAATESMFTRIISGVLNLVVPSESISGQDIEDGDMCIEPTTSIVGVTGDCDNTGIWQDFAPVMTDVGVNQCAYQFPLPLAGNWNECVVTYEFFDSLGARAELNIQVDRYGNITKL